MNIKIANLWYHIQSSFWFLPSLMASAAILLALITTAIDGALAGGTHTDQWWIYGGGPEGARSILSAITSSMITVAGVVFSITIVVLSQASSQFGPRLIRNFMNIRSNQMVLGAFVATYMYGMLVLGTVKQSGGADSVPNISVSITIVLAFVSLGVMIYFIHNVSETIQAQNIIARVHRDLENAVSRIFPQPRQTGDSLAPPPIHRDYTIPDPCDREVCAVHAAGSGYLQAVDDDALMVLAVEHDLLIHLGYRPGHFVTRGSRLATVWPGDRVDETLSTKINGLCIVGTERTLEQDVEYAISQMVEVAVRALSPGINDPITAMTCIDWLGETLCRLANRRMPESHRFDDNHRLRVIFKTFTFAGMVDSAFNMIRQNAQAVPAVSIHLLEAIATVAAQTPEPADREVLMRHAAMVTEGCSQALTAEEDRRDLEARYAAATAALGDAQRDASDLAAASETENRDGQRRPGSTAFRTQRNENQ